MTPSDPFAMLGPLIAGALALASLALLAMIVHHRQRTHRERTERDAHRRRQERGAEVLAARERWRRERAERTAAVAAFLAGVPAGWAEALTRAEGERDALPWLAFARWCDGRGHGEWAATARSRAAELGSSDRPQPFDPPGSDPPGGPTG